MLNFQTSDIAGCLISHEHKDHCMAVQDVLRTGIDTYMSAGTAETIGITHHRIKPIKALESFEVGTWKIMPFNVEHDVAEPLGFLLANRAGEKLLFATDTYYIRYRFRGLTHLLIECNYSKAILDQNIIDGVVPKVMRKRLIQSHMSLENLIDFLTANDLSKIQEIHLLHLSDTNSDEALFKRTVQKLTGKLVFIA
ncbi:MBL fold metallo-hydrolase [Gracilibacillus alcaliphilus]